MRILHTIIGAALVAAFVIGCSKSSSQQPHQVSTPLKVKDLGVLGFTEGTPQHFSLGDDKSCTLTAKRVSGEIEIVGAFEATNAGGTVSVIGSPRVTVLPGRQCAMSAGDVGVKFTPRWKTP